MIFIVITKIYVLKFITHTPLRLSLNLHLEAKSMSEQTKNIPINKILLDPYNPRYPSERKTEADMIKSLLDDEKVINLAKHLCKYGINPLDKIGVLKIPNKDEYIVLEGNRRLCALKLLNNPKLCLDENKQKIFSRLNQQHTLVDSITCHVFQTREDADRWIALRHEGQQDGIGLKPWDAKQIARHKAQKGRKSVNMQASQLLEYAVQENIIPPEKVDLFKITTMQRYLNNPIVRHQFGLVDGSSLKTQHTQEDFDKLVKQFLKDSLPIDAKTPAILSSRSNRNDWKNYAESLRENICEPPKNNSQTIDLSIKSENNTSDTLSLNEKGQLTLLNTDIDISKDESLQKNKSPPFTKEAKTHQATTSDPFQKENNNTKKYHKNDANRKYLIPNEIKFYFPDVVHRRLYNEIKLTEVENHEFAIAFLLRAFIESLAINYLKKHNSSVLTGETKLQKKLEHVRKDLIDNKKEPEKKLNILNTAINDKNSMISPFVLGTMVHISTVPTKHELLRIWDAWQPVLLLINKHCQTE